METKNKQRINQLKLIDVATNILALRLSTLIFITLISVIGILALIYLMVTINTLYSYSIGILAILIIIIYRLNDLKKTDELIGDFLAQLDKE